MEPSIVIACASEGDWPDGEGNENFLSPAIGLELDWRADVGVADVYTPFGVFCRPVANLEPIPRIRHVGRVANWDWLPAPAPVVERACLAGRSERG